MEHQTLCSNLMTSDEANLVPSTDSSPSLVATPWVSLHEKLQWGPRYVIPKFQIRSTLRPRSRSELPRIESTLGRKKWFAWEVAQLPTMIVRLRLFFCYNLKSEAGRWRQNGHNLDWYFQNWREPNRMKEWKTRYCLFLRPFSPSSPQRMDRQIENRPVDTSSA